MRSLTFAPLLLASAGAASHGLPEIAISKRDKHNGGATNIYRRSIPAHIEKRQGTVSTNIFDVLSWSNGGAYYANITVGTPPQEQTVILDTGSSDLYFDASSAATCKTTGETACKGGTFDPSKSNTYHESAASPAFNTSFGDGSTAVGPYSTDNIGIGDVVISNVQFGVADEVNSTTGYSIGLMGVGYSYNEAVRDERNLYPNMPEVLKDAGVINSRLYSVFLNEVGDTSGTILFGGIDKSKYTGELATLDLLPADTQSDLIYQFITTVTAANVTVSGKTSSLWSGGSNNINAYGRNDASLPVLLDTGSTAWTIPANYYNDYIAPAFSYVQRDGTCQCKNANNNDHLSLQFGGKVTINVPSTQFIVPLINSTTNEQVKYNDGSDACLFLLQPASGDEGIAFQTLGDAILTSMYVVFDLDNGQVSVAQAATNGGSPNVVTVQAGSSGVASAVQGVNTAPPNSYSIAPQITAATNSYGVSTAASTIGTATGEAAVPADAQVSGESGGSGSGTGSGSSSSSSGAAAGLVMPGADSTGFWITSIWVALGALGAGIML